MTPDFKPGKAYLIEGKGIEQVKDEIKDWFFNNDLDLLDEGPYNLEGYKFSFIFKYEVWIKLKLIENPKGVILAFNNHYVKKYPMFPFPTVLVRGLIVEMRNNLIRFLIGEKEIKINLDIFYIVLYSIIILVSSLGYYSLLTNGYLDPTLVTFLVNILLVILISIISWLIVKNISLSDKYYLEEYKGEIEID
jgi:hypothetical protein